ncbi:hypothetical protein C8R45DRAFT_983426 [Mycena sanguinolenta]|nr:hypothetical protein C8R45DRAFT_983426 [Mycena sanguinolenta]
MSLQTLPDDVQCRVLSFLADFSVLNALLLTSRSFRSVFLTRRGLVLSHVAQNFLGLALGDEVIETGDSNASESVKFLIQAKESIETLEPIVFRVLIEPDDGPDRCPSLTESTRIRRAAYRYAKFCTLPSELQQGRFLLQLETIEAFELLHFVDGLRKVVSMLLDGVGGQDAHLVGCVGRLISTGPANIYRLWKLRPRNDGMEQFHAMMSAAARAEDDDHDNGSYCAFDDAFHYFEVSRNISAFDATRTRPLLDVGQQQTKEEISNLECLMEPLSQPLRDLPDLCFSSLLCPQNSLITALNSPATPSRPRRPRFRSLKLPLCDSVNKKSAQLSFLPDHLNSLPIWSHIPYAMLVLNGEPRIMPLSPSQLAELVNTMHL